MHLRSDRRGFAMPMVILVIGFMTAAVLAAFTRSGAEFQMVDNHQLQTDAFAVAEAGLQAFFANGRVSPTTATYTYPNGTATVTATRMRNLVGSTPAIWLVTSVGTVTSTTGRGGPPARRTVAQFADMPLSSMNVTSALTSLSGVIKSGTSGAFIGQDECGVAPALPGAQIPSGGTWAGASNMVTGSPAIDSTMTQTQLLAATTIDWAGMVNPAGSVVTPDIVICGTGATGNFGTCGNWPSFSDPDYWPVIMIDGSFDLRSNHLVPNGIGRGTLIVTQNLDLGGNVEWDGIMLVGGILRDNGSGDQAGAAVAGLNLLIGGTVGGYSSDMNGTKTFQYNSCSVAKASQGFSRLAPIQNAWVDNWTSW